MRDRLLAVFEAWRPSEARDSQDLTLVQRLALEERPCEPVDLNVGQLARFLLNMSERDKVMDALWYPRLERAIGVVYLPERLSHYFHARLSDQFDAVLHFDETRAAEPLERTAEWEVGEAPETFPFGV